MAGMSNLHNTTRKCIIGGIVTGAGAFIGGLIGGPIGIGVGSAIGATIGSAFLRFRSAPNVFRNDFNQNERRDLLERARRAVADSKESLIRLLMEILEAVFRCQSRKEFIEKVLMPIVRELAYVGLRTILQYLAHA